jgi:DNA-binding HxlR family transcriptional regulator
MIPVFDEILNVLYDGKPHRFEEVNACCNLNALQVEATLVFLEEYGFVYRQRFRHTTSTRTAKLTPRMASFLKHLRELGP